MARRPLYEAWREERDIRADHIIVQAAEVDAVALEIVQQMVLNHSINDLRQRHNPALCVEL